MKTNKFFAIVIYCLLSAAIVTAQDSIFNSNKISNKYYHSLEKKATKLQDRLTKQSNKALQSLQEQENKIYAALHKIDSFKAKELMGNGKEAYTALQQKITDKTKKLTAPFSGSYVASLDSMTGVLGFLKSQGLVPPLGAEGAVKGLSSTLNQAEAIKKFIKEREGQLKTITAQYKDLPASITKSLGKYNKELYYYSQQIQEVKATLKDPAKIEATVLKYLQKVPAFKKWMQQNGQLAQIFGSGSSPLGEAGVRPSLAGLQTTAGLQQLIQSRLGNTTGTGPTPGGVNPQQFVNGQLQTAMNNLQQQRTRLQNALRSGQAGGTGSSSDVMPDFTPNSQKTKTFWKRLEKGYNLQASQRRGQFPSVNDLGLSLGYKPNDKSVIGIGLAYKFGLGESFNKIKWTSEGIAIRFFLDVKWKGNLWISTGYEQSYWQRFTLFGGGVVPPLGGGGGLAWVQSGLIGISKKVKKGKKEVKLQLLYDFLQPRTGGLPVVFRWGSNF